MMPALPIIHEQNGVVVLPEELQWTSCHGLCAGVRITFAKNSSESLMQALLVRLHPEEVRLAGRMPGRRALDWVGGRIAVREAMKSTLPGGCRAPVFSTPRGAPLIPGGFCASISHKSNESEVLAVALVARAEEGSIGIDLEIVDEPREAIAPLVLTPAELKKVQRLPGPDRWLQILLHFSLKEAVYKAIDPVVQRYVDYQEASLNLSPEGSAEIIWHTAGLQGLQVEALWTMRGRYILTSAKTLKY